MCLKGHMENGQEGTWGAVERAIKQLLQYSRCKPWVGSVETGRGDRLMMYFGAGTSDNW